MSLAISELLHTLGVAVAAFAVLSLLAMFLKAESATWKKPEDSAPR
jgi:Na+-transporting methylmalonyl-CoA/oxaloacetate decarboxylase gamma subunit